MEETISTKRSIYDLVAKNYRYVVYVITGLVAIYVAGFGSMSDMNQRAGLVTMLCPTVFTLKPLVLGKAKRSYWWTKLIDAVLTIGTIIGGVYMLLAWPTKMLKASAFSQADIILGWVMLICILEATRRSTGLIVTITAVVFLLYMHFGYLFDGVLGHRGESWQRIISTLYVSTEGLFGSSVGVAASYIILFVVFGAFLKYSGFSNSGTCCAISSIPQAAQAAAARTRPQAATAPTGRPRREKKPPSPLPTWAGTPSS